MTRFSFNNINLFLIYGRTYEKDTYFLVLIILYSCEFNDVQDNLEKAEKYYDNKNYNNAIEELNKVINAKSNYLIEFILCLQNKVYG